MKRTAARFEPDLLGRFVVYQMGCEGPEQECPRSGSLTTLRSKCYSKRSATMGSIRMALLAGT